MSPRHQELALLYPRSLSLQAHINEYFIVVVTLCLSTVRFAQKSALRQFTSTLSDPTIKSAQSDLAKWARAIDDEVRLLIAKRIENEAEENSRFRSLSKKFSKSVSHQQEVVAKLRILNECSTYDYQTTWKQLRKSGNTTLFSQTLQYTKWRAEKTSCTLIYLGILGCGKSVTMANIVDDLNLHIAEAQHTSVAYFFIRPDISASMKARTITGAIARQLLRTNIGITDLVEHDHDSLCVEDLLQMLRRSIPRQQRTYLILDGLDLCSDDDKQEVTDFIQELQKQSLVLVCASYRQEPNVELEPKLRKLQSVQAVPLPNNHTDIEAYIEMELASRIESRSLILGDPTLVLDIQDALLRGSQGMFLWVALQILSLCTLQTDDEIRDALVHLPQDLSAIYAQLLRKQDGTGSSYQKRVFELIAAARRPLTITEIREALSVTPGDTTWAAGKLINDVYAALSTCGCLVIIDEEELTVRLVHHTVLQYLFERYDDSSDGALSLESCHRSMVEIVTTYLSYGVFMTDISTFVVPRINVGLTPSKIISSTVGSSKSAQHIALRLLKLRKRADFDIGKTVAEGLQIDQQDEAVVFIFHHYAKENCLEHAIRAQKLGSQSQRLLFALLTKSDSPLVKFDGSSAEGVPNYSSVTLLAVQNNAVDLMSLLLSVYRVTELTPGGDHFNFLSIAVCMGWEEMTYLITSIYGPNHLPMPLEYRETICLWAYKDRLRQTEQELVEVAHITDKALSHICDSGRSLLSCSIWGGNTDTFDALMADARVDVNAGRYQMTPMWEAVRMASRVGPKQQACLDMLEALIRSGKVVMDTEQEEALKGLADSSSNKDVCYLLQQTLWRVKILSDGRRIRRLVGCTPVSNAEERYASMEAAAESGNQESFETLMTPIWKAVNDRDVDALNEIMYFQKYDPASWAEGEQAALHKFAIHKGEMKIIDMLQVLPDVCGDPPAVKSSIFP